MSVSVIIPVYNEAESLPLLLAQFQAANDYELIIVDDSPDNLTVESIKNYTGTLKISLIHRKKRLGLASAVIDGFNAASGDILICMDGDGSHPPELIPKLIEALNNHEMVFASRYTEGGSVDPGWNFMRRFISTVCCLITRPLSGIQDPMSGYFGLSKSKYESIKSKLKPISYKIALEIIVRGDIKKIAEVPFCFNARLKGKSKINFSVISGMLFHFCRLYLNSIGKALKIIKN